MPMLNLFKRFDRDCCSKGLSIKRVSVTADVDGPEVWPINPHEQSASSLRLLGLPER